MNYTEKYHLPQWEETDRIMRTDFNKMCADIEAGLKKTAQDAASGISETAADAVAASAAAAASAATAQATANQAVAAAAAAQATADAAYCPSNLPYVIGTYTGKNTEQTVTVGFLPSFLIITCPIGRDVHKYTLAAGSGMNSERLQFTATGFRVMEDGVDGGTHTLYPPLINYQGMQYLYIAFR